ncbi:MAG: 2-oxoacid:acceptor oxidoreductase subunit alpha [Methanomicrobiales archaeon]|nr:2-oxoacid:acceptor oxidoreductase subunit alpha [Methanomicrobiales archaeon]
MSKISFIQGNIACAEGALAAGCRFFGGYPITPSTEIAEHMAMKLPKVKGTFIQMEDEIGSIAAVIGAAWTGVRAMTATSGPGLSLMMENIGYAVMTETPLVIVDIQRGGPSTGQPTMASQGDMFQCRFGSHGDYSIIALSPATVQEMYEMTAEAFNLADRFRVPVFLMADEIIGHMREKMTLPDTVPVMPVRERTERSTLPFKAEKDGVPGFTPFGKGHHVHVTGLTHDERGYPSTTNPDVHERLVTRLVAKVESTRREIASYDVTNPEAETVFVSYGAPTRAVWQALHDLKDDTVGHFRLKMVWPFPDWVEELFPQAQAYIVPEMNLGLISRELERHVTIPVISVPRLGGALHEPEELIRAVEGAK